MRNLVCTGVSERVAMLLTGHKMRAVFESVHSQCRAVAEPIVAVLAR